MIEFRAVQDGERVDESPAMSSVLRLCRKCGAKIFADAPEGRCTVCLFETGLDLFAPGSVDAADPSGLASAKADDRILPEDVEQSNTIAALNVKKGSRLTKTPAKFGE